MVVWVLSFGECDLAELNGVYSTKEKAIEAFNHHCKDCSDYIKNVELDDQDEIGVYYSFDFVDTSGWVETTREHADIIAYGLDEVASGN